MRAIGAVLMFLVSVSLFAQRFDDTVTVNVVEVPVYVERFGVPVAGLTREDFELFVNGQPQSIEYFDVIEDPGKVSVTESPSPQVRAEAPSAAELNRRRLIVLLFDVGASTPYAVYNTQKKAMQYVAGSPAGDTFAVATIARAGIRFIVPFTRDRAAIARAIATFKQSDAGDPFSVATLDSERAVWGTSAGVDEARGDLPDYAGAAGILKMLAMEERYADNRVFTHNLENLADQLAPLSGIKHVVLLSERDMVPDQMRHIAAAQRVHEHFRAAGVILDGVDIRLPRVPGGMASEASPRGIATAAAAGQLGKTPSFFFSDFLYSLALDTGGTVDGSLENLAKRNSITYVLGFAPPRTPKKQNSIRVRVKDRRVFTEVRYRESYTLGERDPKNDLLFLADTLLNDIEHRGVTLDLAVKGNSLVATIPGVELLTYRGDKPLLLDVYLYVFDEKQQPAAWKYVQLSVDLAKGRDFLSAHPYTVRQEFNLPSGRYAAKAIVRVVGTDKTGFAREDFVTAAPAGNGSAAVSQHSIH